MKEVALDAEQGMEVAVDEEQGVELAVDAEQRMEELEGDNEMQSSRSSALMWIAAQPRRGGKEKLQLVPTAARRDSGECPQTLGGRRELAFIRVPDLPPFAKSSGMCSCQAQNHACGGRARTLRARLGASWLRLARRHALARPPPSAYSFRPPRPHSSP
jgi:hypothetical protein